MRCYAAPPAALGTGLTETAPTHPKLSASLNPKTDLAPTASLPRLCTNPKLQLGSVFIQVARIAFPLAVIFPSSAD